MFRLVLAFVLMLWSATAAQASCTLRPDNAESRYVENGQAYALCLQDELGEATAARAAQARIEAAIRNMRIQLELERQRQQQLLLGARGL